MTMQADWEEELRGDLRFADEWGDFSLDLALTLAEGCFIEVTREFLVVLKAEEYCVSPGATLEVNSVTRSGLSNSGRAEVYIPFGDFPLNVYAEELLGKTDLAQVLVEETPEFMPLFDVAIAGAEHGFRTAMDIEEEELDSIDSPGISCEEDRLREAVYDVLYNRRQYASFVNGVGYELNHHPIPHSEAWEVYEASEILGVGSGIWARLNQPLPEDPWEYTQLLAGNPDVRCWVHNLASNVRNGYDMKPSLLEFLDHLGEEELLPDGLKAAFERVYPDVWDFGRFTVRRVLEALQQTVSAL